MDCDWLRGDKTADPRSEKGSFLIAAALFMILFLGVASIGIDGARYYMKQGQLQNIADGAALEGAQALNQYDTRPDLSEVNESIVNYIRETQGEEHADLYDASSPENSDHIRVRRMQFGEDGCQVKFNIDNGSISINQPFNAQTRVLGSAVSATPDDRDMWPVTARVRVENEDQPDSTFHPWGDWTNPNDANLNQPGAKPSLDLTNYPPDKKIRMDARYYNGYDGNSLAAEKSSTSQDVVVLRDGDPVPDTGADKGQTDVADYLDAYVNEDGEMDLANNQAIYLFELTHAHDDSEADFQDLVTLMSFKPSDGFGSPSSTINNDPTGSSWAQGQCSPGTPLYRVGVLTYEEFTPYFLPEAVFGSDNTVGLNSLSVAEASYQNVIKASDEPIDCGIFADAGVTINSNNLDGDGMDVCSNGDVSMASSNNGTIGDMYTVQGNVLQPPGGDYADLMKVDQPFNKPTFNRLNSSNYDVDLSQFSLWSEGSCSGGGPPGGNTTHEMEANSTTTETVEWSDSGDPVCVTYDSSLNTYYIAANNEGRIQFSDGTSVTIYADGNVQFGGNGSGINGGLYAEGDIAINDNTHTFASDINNQGGLALWAGGQLSINGSNVSLQGLVGSEGDLLFTGSGGGNDYSVNGMLVTHGEFLLQANSANVQFNYAPQFFEDEALDNLDQTAFQQDSAEKPTFSNIKVKLVE